MGKMLIIVGAAEQAHRSFFDCSIFVIVKNLFIIKVKKKKKGQPKHLPQPRTPEGQARALWGMNPFSMAVVQSTTNWVGRGGLKPQKSFFSQFGRFRGRWVPALS